jgi:uncharacterized protein (TIGR00251 family)
LFSRRSDTRLTASILDLQLPTVMREWCSECGNGVRLAIQVAPNAQKNEVIGPLDNCLKIRLQAQPVEGQANAALIRYLAERLCVARSAVSVTHGLASKRKLIEILTSQLSVHDVKALLWKP